MAEKDRTQINLRLLPEEPAAFRAAAAAVGLDLTTWLRMLARREAGMPTVAGMPAPAPKRRKRTTQG